MSLDEKIKLRIEELLISSQFLVASDSEGCAVNDQQCSECAAWITAAINAINLTCDGTDAYSRHAHRIAERSSGWLINKDVSELAATLRHLLKDAQNGLLGSVANKAIAMTFDDFLDHASEYAKQNQKNEAGVIAGVVFEDAVRKVCVMNGIDIEGKTLEPLINALSSKQVITGTKSKRSKVAAHVRSKASHALWDQFDLADVEATIQFSREFIEEFLE